MRVLGRVNGNLTRAAEMLGVSPAHALRPACTASGSSEPAARYHPTSGSLAMKQSPSSTDLVAGRARARLVARAAGLRPGRRRVLSSRRPRSYLEKSDYSAAIIQLRNAREKEPDNAEIRFLLGEALLESGEFGPAETELRKAEALKYPADAVAAGCSRRSLLAQGDVAQGRRASSARSTDRGPAGARRPGRDAGDRPTWRRATATTPGGRRRRAGGDAGSIARALTVRAQLLGDRPGPRRVRSKALTRRSPPRRTSPRRRCSRPRS